MYSIIDQLRIDGYLELYLKRCTSKKENEPTILIDFKKYWVYSAPFQNPNAKKIEDEEELNFAKLVFNNKANRKFFFDGVYHTIKSKSNGVIIYNSDKCDIVFCSSLTSFLKKISDLKKSLPSFRIYFRGQSSNYAWIPSLYRKDAWVKKESELNLTVLSKHVSDFSDCHTTIEKLIKLKHFNQPSRLLDIVENPLMALYFACESSDHEKSDGMISVIFSNPADEKFSLNSDTVVELSNISNINYEKYYSTNESETVFFSELGHQCRKEEKIDSYWNDINAEKLNQCIIVHPELNNPRIIHQQGLFLLCGFDGTNKVFLTFPQEQYTSFFLNPNNKKRIYYHFSKRALSSIKVELDSFGINRSQVYFDLEKTIEYEKNKVVANEKV